MKKCEYCGKLTNNKKFCSNECRGKYLKKYKTSNFHSSEFQTEMNKRANGLGGHNAQKILKVQNKSFYNSKIQSENALKTHEKCKNNGTGLWNLNKKIQSMGGKISSELLRKNIRNIHYLGLYFDSNAEAQFALNIYYQLEKLVEGKNYQVLVGNLHYDFLIEKCMCFIDYHPYNRLYDKDDITLEKYYKLRRDNLNKNGYKEYNLIII